MRFVRYEELRGLGIPFSRVHVDRLQKANRFPRKVKLGANTAAYRLDEIEAWLTARCAERASPEPA
jgi:prophage regulatory protein